MKCRTCQQPINYMLALPEGVHVLPAAMFHTTKAQGEQECDFCKIERRLQISRAALADQALDAIGD